MESDYCHRLGKERTMNTLWGSYRALMMALLVFNAISAVSPVNASNGLLDGKTFAGETGEKGKAKGDKEQFIFADNKYDPLACHKYGFSSTSYTAQAKGNSITFIAEHSNEKGDRMRWYGTAQGNTLEGVMTYWQGKKAPREYWFRGTLVQ